MATKKIKEEEKKVDEPIKDDAVAEDTAEDQAENNQEDEPEDEPEKPGKVKAFLGKVKNGAKKALPYLGAFAAGAGAAVGALIVLTKPDGSELELIEKDDDIIPVDQFIEGEATVVDAE